MKYKITITFDTGDFAKEFTCKRITYGDVFVTLELESGSARFPWAAIRSIHEEVL